MPVELRALVKLHTALFCNLQMEVRLEVREKELVVEWNTAMASFNRETCECTVIRNAETLGI